VQKVRVHCRSYSRPLQRAVTDFGADVSFSQAAEKMREHYGIEISACAIQKITRIHAKAIAKYVPKKGSKEGVQLLIAEMDGGMVPIVEVDEKVAGVDLRKTRKVLWKEAKLCFARVHGKVSRIYGAVIGTPEEAGAKLYECAKRAGFIETTYVHALGDGAQWIVDQMEEQFGSQAHFLVDFFHVCEYLAEAAPWCNALEPKAWLQERKKMMKIGKARTVFNEMKRRLCNIEKIAEDNGMVKCVRYMEKRIKYMKYLEAREKDLPIGSGEIESSHRHIVQKRLKIAGAWWKVENANAMLQLRTARANKYWADYWRESKAA
jgi:hypothetical protein